MKVLITGISGQFGRLVAGQLSAAKHQIIGLDVRPWPDAPDGVQMHRVDVRKRAAENVFRTGKPDAVIHMATVNQLIERSADVRARINLGGTRAVFERCHRYEIPRVLFIGRHTFYGAAPDSPLYHTEDEPPMGLGVFPELSDMVAADLYAGSALWRYPKIKTAVLRMCYTLGPRRHGTLATFLRGPRVPTILGFDPLYQFMHEDDSAAAICASLDGDLCGVYNVAGPPPVTLSLLIRLTGRTQIPVPEPVFRFALGRFGLPTLPLGALDHIKYPLVIDDSRFRQVTGFQPRYDEDRAMESFRWG